MINRFSLALLALLLPAAAFAQAPDNSRIGYTQTGGCPGTPAPPTCFVQYGSTIPIVGTITATLGGFAPNGAYSTPLSVSGTTSNVALPVGSPAATVVVVSNIGTTNTAYVNLGTSGAVTATTSNIPVPPQSSVALTIGTNTFLAAITSTSTTTLNIAGGAGLFTGFGGGGSGGGGGGGTSSNFGSAFPSTGTAFGLTDGTNMIGLKGSATLGAFENVAGWAGSALGAPSNYGTSPGTVAVPGVNAFVTNTPAITCAACATSANQSTQITAEQATATASGTPADSAYGGSGSTTTIGGLKGLYSALTAAVPACGTTPCTNVIGLFDIDQATPGTTNGVVVNSSALPSGAATSANQTTGNSSLSTIATNTGTVAGAVTSSVMQDNLKQVNGVTTLAGAGATGTGSQRVTAAQDTTTIAGNAPANAGQGATGSAVPAGATYQGVNVGGNLTGPIGCGSSVVYDASTNGSTQLVALSSGKVVYVCGYTILAGGTVNVELDYGTGTACATGNNKLTPAYQLTAQAGVVDGAPYYRGMATAASNELCLKTSAGVAVQAVVYYTQF